MVEIVLWFVGGSFVGFVGMMIIGACQPEEAAMPVMTNGTTNGHGEVKVSQNVTPQVEGKSKLTIALAEATKRYHGRDGHAFNCGGVHCMPHALLRPYDIDAEFCIPNTVYKASHKPRLLMCRHCVDILVNLEDMGVITAISLI
jgi:hypothetical protein